MSCNLEIGADVGKHIMEFQGYKVGSVIGVGGHGIVYKISLKDDVKGPMYALKVVSFDNNDEEKQKFKNEKLVLKKFSNNGKGSAVTCIHKGINCYIKVSDTDHCGYIVTELYDNDLFGDLEKNGSFSDRMIGKVDDGYLTIKQDSKLLEEEITTIKKWIVDMPHTQEMIQKLLDRSTTLIDDISKFEYKDNHAHDQQHTIIQKFISRVKQMVEAIEYMHKKNMAHGDIKPQNVLVRVSDERVVLTDFDTVYFGKGEFECHDMTPIFASPKLNMRDSKKQKVSLRDVQISDVWALALTVLIMWFGHDKIMRILNSTTGSPRTFATAVYNELSIPEKADQIFDRMKAEILDMKKLYPRHESFFNIFLLNSVGILGMINGDKKHVMDTAEEYMHYMRAVKS